MGLSPINHQLPLDLADIELVSSTYPAKDPEPMDDYQAEASNKQQLMDPVGGGSLFTLDPVLLGPEAPLIDIIPQLSHVEKFRARELRT